MSCDGHQPNSVGRRLTELLHHLHRGGSALVRPVTPYDGLDRTIDLLQERCGATLLVTDVQQSSHGDQPADPAGCSVFAFHTSGSTGAPKCVVYRTEVACAHAEAIAQRLELHNSLNSYVSFVPPQFAYGLSIAHSHQHAATPVRFHPLTLGAETLLEALTETTGPLALYLLPQQVPLLLGAPLSSEQASRVQQILVAGGTLSSSAVGVLRHRFPDLATVTNMYGQAELGPRIATWQGPASEFREGLVGDPLRGVKVRVDDGRIEVSTPYAMDGQIRTPYERYEPHDMRTGFRPTGDTGLLDQAGLHVQGRHDHQITVAGTQVDLQRLTELLSHQFRPLALRVTAHQTPRGPRPVVDLVPHPHRAVTERELRTAIHGEIGSIAAMVRVRVGSELAPSESGK